MLNGEHSGTGIWIIIKITLYLIKIETCFLMTDIHSKEVRSYNMSMVRGKNTQPEITVRKYLFNHGFRYRINVLNLPGKPDIVLKKYETVIFINGCFWHGHTNCSRSALPKTRTAWWSDKIQRTKERDIQDYNQLQQLGWRVLVVWECQLRSKKQLETLDSLAQTIRTKYNKM